MSTEESVNNYSLSKSDAIDGDAPVPLAYTQGYRCVVSVRPPKQRTIKIPKPINLPVVPDPPPTWQSEYLEWLRSIPRPPETVEISCIFGCTYWKGVYSNRCLYIDSGWGGAQKGFYWVNRPCY